MDVNEFINKGLGISVRTYTEGFTIYINAEDIARGLGFIEKEREEKFSATCCAKKIYHQPEKIRWCTINKR